MKKDMNLLPWRAQQQRQQNRILFLMLLGGALLSTAGALLLAHIAEEYADYAGKAMAQHTSQQQALQTTQLQIQQFRQTHTQAETLNDIPKETVFSLLHQLAQFPLTQGELTELHLDASHLTLKGYAENQEEFSRLNGFLTEQALFDDVKLVEFKPQAQALYFQFDLNMKVTP